MKLAASVLALAGSAAAFAPSQSNSRASTGLSLTVRCPLLYLASLSMQLVVGGQKIWFERF